MAQLRCPHKMHGVIDEEACTIETKCNNSRCGARSGVVVLHRFDLFTGDLISTAVFREPVATRGGEVNGTASVRAPIRHP